MPPALKGLMMNMCAVAGLASSGTRRATRLDLPQRVDEPVRRSGDRRAAGIGRELARPRDGRLDQAGGDRREDHHEQQRRGVRALAVVTAAAEEHREPRRHHDRRGDRRGHRADEDVAVLHVRELVGDHAIEFFRAERAQDAFGGSHRRVLRVAPGRKRVRRAVGDDVHPAASAGPRAAQAAPPSRTAGARPRPPARDTCCRTILSEKKYDTKLVPAAKRNAISRPCAPPSTSPMKQQQRAQRRRGAPSS